MTFIRDRLTPETINIEGQACEAWKSGHQSVVADDWARSFLIKVTDPRFRDGKKPLVDVEIVYCHEANTKVEVFADSGAGNALVATGWGNEKKWKTIKFRLKDAFFGSRDFANDQKKLPVDGYDLRINAAAGDFYLRSVKITGYDVSDNPDYAELLKIEGVTPEGGNFVAGEGKAKKVVWNIRNEALKPTETDWQIKVLNAEGKTVREVKGRSALAAGTTSALEAEVPTAELGPGFYALELRAYPPRAAPEKPWFEDRRELIIPDPYELFVLFDKEPVSRGLEFAPRNVSPQTFNQETGTVSAWSAAGGSSDEFPWARSWYFRVTDPKFLSGAQAAVDVEIVYRYEANAPVNVIVDTAEGPKQVAGGWGNNPGFQTLRFRLDNAFFGQRVPGSKTPAAGEKGYDFRLNAFNTDVAIRSIRVKGYDLSDKPDWKRLARLEKITGDKDIFAFAKGEKASLHFHMRNLALKPVDLAYNFQLLSPDGVALGSSEGNLTLKPGQADAIHYPVGTEKLPYGVYTIRLKTDAKTPTGFENLYEHETSFAIHSPVVLPKAGDKEFLYGLDVVQGSPLDHPAFVQWATVMGVDIFRNGGPAITDFAAMDKALEIYGKAGLSTQMMPEPRYNPDAKQRAAAVAELAGQAEAFAARYKDRVTYYELGNEPDLTFFYPGPIEDYLEGFVTLRDAIKRGNPGAKVMNGGLAFFGEDGMRRSKSFVEKVPKSKIDILAYHGHGPGADSERKAYERIAAIIRGTDKADKPLADTESGFAAKTARQERIQARTAIQKLVYAQSVGSPLFYWFRLYFTGAEASYSSLKTPQEPRPVILAYRTTVEMLRGYQFSRLFDFDQSGAEGYVFEKPNGQGNVLVTWGGEENTVYRTLELGGLRDTDKGVVSADLFGNRKVRRASKDGVLSIGVGADPLFISWQGNAKALKVLPSSIEADPVVNLLPGKQTPVRVKVRNPGKSPAKAQLSYEIAGTPVSGTQEVALPGSGEAVAKVDINLNPTGTALAWPVNWMVYTGFGEGDFDPATFKQIPQSLTVKGREIKGRLLPLQDQILNISALGGGPKERQAALVFAEVESPSEQTVKLGASADWWMACYVNGVKVLDTLKEGNQGGYSIDDHVVEAKLRKGTNLVTFLVLSGSQGWKLLTAGPAELEKEKMGSDGPKEIKWTLRLDGSEVATQASGLRFLQPLEELKGSVLAMTAEAWLKQPRTGILDPGGIKNYFDAFPDSSNWYQGEDDLSGSVWLGLDPDSFVVVVDVRDNKDLPASNAKDLNKSDSVDIALQPAGGKLSVIRVGRVGVAVASSTLEGAELPAKAVVDRVAGNHTLYRLTVPKAALTSGTLYVNVRVNDADVAGVELKQNLTWRPIWSDKKPDPRLWTPVVLP
ncbi:MAG: hypothetical protein SFU85_12870 [Candidatus Methylacidiphilales bacterium]|nr:hypothetical protein [Candidatus Methylacidiphilales bacterium]